MHRSRFRLGLVTTIVWAAVWTGGLASPVAAVDDCGDIADRIRHGGVLWTENAIVVQGTAAPDLSRPNASLARIKRMTQSAATLDAYRKAAGVLTGVRVSSQAIAADSPQVVTRIQAFVRNAKVCRAKYYADGGVDMVVMVPLSGAFAMDQLQTAGTRLATADSDHTGLVVDASHLGFAPAIAPRLLDSAGNVLFDVAAVRTEVIQAHGAVRFVAAGTPAPGELVGPRPLQVRATGLGSASPSDLVLDAEAARALAGGPAFLAEGRVVVLLAPPPAFDCRGGIDAVADRHVDWTQKMVLSRGRGRVNFSQNEDEAVRMRKMERAAEVDAQRKLLETYLAIRVDGRQTVDALPGVLEKAQGIVMNAMRCDAKYFKDGSAEVVMAAPLDAMAALSLDIGRTDLPATAAPDGGPSGVIIDATGLGFQPVLAPQIKSFDGRTLYGPALVSRAYAQQYGLSGYQQTVAAARRDPRVGSRPLEVKASRDDGPGVLLLDGEATRSLARLATGTTVLSRGRVIIVSEKAGSLESAPPAAALNAPAAAPPSPGALSGQGPRVRVGKINIP